MFKGFTYVFTVGGKLMYSNDTHDNIINRADNACDSTKLRTFVESCDTGDFMSLSTGEMIFCTYVRK